MRRRWFAQNLLIALTCGFLPGLTGYGGLIANGATLAPLVASPTQVAFGKVSVGKTTSATVLLVNSGSAPIKVTHLALTGSSFSVPGQSSLSPSINAGATYRLNLQFAPATAGSAAGQLTITSNAVNSKPALVSLSGVGVAPAVATGVLFASPSQVNFGTVSVGQKASATVTLSNESSSPLVVTQLGITGKSFFFAGQNNLPITISAGTPYRLKVQFDAVASGAATGQLTVTSNSATGSISVITLTGTGAAPSASPSPFANISIGATPGKEIPPTFMGLSHEWGTAQMIMGDSTNGADSIYRQLLQNLTAYGSGPIYLRIGGDSTDQTLEPTSTTAQAFAELAVALGTTFSLGVNLGADNVNLAVDQTEAYVSQMPPGSVDAIEIGNEPDLYAQGGTRPLTYNYQDYLADFDRWKDSILPFLPAGTKLMGPSWANAGSLRNTQSYESDEASTLAIFSQHYYVANGEAKNPDDILLTPNAATVGPKAVAAAVATTPSFVTPFRMGEMNSLYNGGELGISNTFQSALWAVDTMFEYANVGVDGVNWHGGGTSPYTYFAILATHSRGANKFTLAAVNPLYYGLLFFQAATGSGAHLLPVTLDTDANLKAWATVDVSGTPRLALINKDENASGTVDITLSGYSQAQIYRLSAPNYLSTSGVTFAGQTFDGSTNGVIQGAQTTESVSASDGIFEVAIPITSAALVVFTK